MGDLEGLFVCSPEELEKVQGNRIHFGEVLGKHSEIIDDGDGRYTLLSDDQDKISWLVNMMGGSRTISGYNPLNYLEEEDDNEEGEGEEY